ncbi:MAG: twin-arginine translocase TatA/TatE family subunit [Bacteroidales bacterium]|nr:twin-arginine translocase TatA/TatE family subunit [Bacteroidales bacterium]
MESLFIVMLPLGVIGPWQWVIIALVIVLLFGGKKIPELMHGLGKGVKSFKAGMKDAEKDIQEIKAEIVKDDDEKKPEKKEEEKKEA